MEELAPGLRRWATRHEEWAEDVASFAVDTSDGLVLVDPLEPPPEVRAPAHVLITVFFHARDAGGLEGTRVWGPGAAAKRLSNRGVTLTDPVEDAELPGGIRALPTPRSGEVVYWLPEQRAVVAGDVLLGAGAKPGRTDDPLRLCPARWLGGGATHDDLRAALRPLLALPVELVLPSHGEPVRSDARAALEAVLL